MNMRLELLYCHVLFLVCAEVSALSFPQHKPMTARVNCPTPAIHMGQVRLRQRTRFVKFSCNSGYTLVGNKYSTCIRGRWDNPTPKCVRATCSAVHPPANGFIYREHGGAALYFFCNSDHQLHGPNATYCDGSVWDAPLPTCLPADTAPARYCDFERPDVCGWNHDLNDDFDWTRMNFQTPSGTLGTGPSHDHTLGADGDGYYMYIESSSRNENDTARLISPVFSGVQPPPTNSTSSGHVCLQFFYHMYGYTTGTLRVYVKAVSDGSWQLDEHSAIFAKHGNQGDQWYESYSDLGVLSEDYQIIIEGVRGTGYVSDIAVDDVRIIENCTPTTPTTMETGNAAVVSTTARVVDVMSCRGRCNQHDSARYVNYILNCDCDDGCYEQRRCCPDYLELCAFAPLNTSSSSSSNDVTTDVTDVNGGASTPPVDISSYDSSSADVAGQPLLTTAVTRLPPPPTTTTSATIMLPSSFRTKPVAMTTPTTARPTIGHVVRPPSAHDAHMNGGGALLTGGVVATGILLGVLLVVGVWCWRSSNAAHFGSAAHALLLMRTRHTTGDSQSDVRFLNNDDDQHLDFSLPRNYAHL